MHPECITKAMLEQAKSKAERNGVIPDRGQDSKAVISAAIGRKDDGKSDDEEIHGMDIRLHCGGEVAAGRMGEDRTGGRAESSSISALLKRANAGGAGDDGPFSEEQAARQWEGGAAATGDMAKGILRSAGMWPSRYYQAENVNASEFNRKSWRSRHGSESSGYNHITLNGPNRWKAQVDCHNHNLCIGTINKGRIPYHTMRQDLVVNGTY